MGSGSKKGGKGAGRRKAAPKKLTTRQEKFVEGVLQHGNATKAAREAGYSEESARVIAAQNLTKLNIQERIHARQAEAKIHTDEIVGTLASHMRGDLTDLLPEGDEIRELARERNVSHLIKKLKRTRRLIPQKDGEPEEVITYEFEMYSAQEAAKQLCSVFGLNKKEGENPEDEQRRVETAIQEYMSRTGAGREEAIKNLIPFIPEVSKYAN